MSKAFLRESDVPEATDPLPRVSTLPPGAKNYLTEEGATILRERLEHWVNVVRPPLAAHSSHGDTRNELLKLDAQIRRLQESLRSAEIIPQGDAGAEAVRIGHVVTVRDSSGELETFRIVGVDETELFPNAISWLSPLARALLNARVGQWVEFRAPRGPQRFQVISIGERGPDV
jgi:transcription elongation factor GreB